jgi:hypothetical protein
MPQLSTPESIILSKRLKIYAPIICMYQGRDQNLQFDRATMWKMDIGSSYNILKVAEQLAHVSAIF